MSMPLFESMIDVSSALWLLRPDLRRHALLGAKDCPMDFQWNVPMDFHVCDIWCVVLSPDLRRDTRCGRVEWLEGDSKASSQGRARDGLVFSADGLLLLIRMNPREPAAAARRPPRIRVLAKEGVAEWPKRVLVATARGGRFAREAAGPGGEGRRPVPT